MRNLRTEESAWCIRQRPLECDECVSDKEVQVMYLPFPLHHQSSTFNGHSLSQHAPSNFNCNCNGCGFLLQLLRRALILSAKRLFSAATFLHSLIAYHKLLCLRSAIHIASFSGTLHYCIGTRRRDRRRAWRRWRWRWRRRKRRRRGIGRQGS